MIVEHLVQRQTSNKRLAVLKRRFAHYSRTLNTTATPRSGPLPEEVQETGWLIEILH